MKILNITTLWLASHHDTFVVPSNETYIGIYFILKFNNNSKYLWLGISLKVVNVYLHIQALVSYLLLSQPPSLVYL